MKHPMNIAGDLQSYGFWYTYWDLRNNWGCKRGQALWLIWVSHNYLVHRSNRIGV